MATFCSNKKHIRFHSTRISMGTMNSFSQLQEDTRILLFVAEFQDYICSFQSNLEIGSLFNYLVIISGVEPFECSHFFIGKKKLKSYFKRILHKWPLPNFSKTIFVAKKVKNQFKEPFCCRKIIVFLLKIATPLSVIQFIDHIIRRTKL